MRVTAAQPRARAWGGPVVGLVAAAGTLVERGVPGPWHGSLQLLSSVPALPLEVPLLLLWGLVTDWGGRRLASYRGQDHLDRTVRALTAAVVAVLAVAAWEAVVSADLSGPGLVRLVPLVAGLVAPSLLGRRGACARGGRDWARNGSTLRGGLRY